jgi:membrane associated rhomboid family serine protease
MLLPIGHENMSARRWPVITLALIVINVVVFLCTFQSLDEQAPHLREVRVHILLLAAMHPELTMPPASQQLVDDFQKRNPSVWKQAKDPNRDLADAWDARVRLIEEPQKLQEEMDSLTSQYAQMEGSSVLERYAFVPAHPAPLSYVTANFLHGGWLHLIGNMWFLWLAGFVLEDKWGRVTYTVFYFLAGAAALQFYAWTNPASIGPALGASGAVAALMGAFLVRFPKMKIEMMWLFRFRSYRFKAEAYWLLPLWLLTEVFYGALFGSSSGVAHWAHVGGFVFGAVIATALHLSGLEHKANTAIEDKLTWKADPEITQATDLIEKGQTDAAIDLLKAVLAKKPDSLDACALLQQTYWRKQDLAAFQEATSSLCALHLKAREPEQAWQLYEEFLNTGGGKMPAATWLELCRSAENQKLFERAVDEYKKLAAAYPSDKQCLVAQIAAGRICLKQLGRPQDALRFFEAASASPVPHLDWEQTIASGIRDAKAAGSPVHP